MIVEEVNEKKIEIELMNKIFKEENLAKQVIDIVLSDLHLFYVENGLVEKSKNIDNLKKLIKF